MSTRFIFTASPSVAPTLATRPDFACNVSPKRQSGGDYESCRRILLLLELSAVGFEPVIYQDQCGEEVEDERPPVLLLEEGASEELGNGLGEAWRKLEANRQCDLFQTPIEHFTVRAYGSTGIHELLAHMTVLEAALGEEADHDRKLRPKPDRDFGATERMARKVAGLLAD